jgi:hypothetical protein
VLCAVTELNSVDVRSLCSCTVCGRMSLSSVVGLGVAEVPVLVKSGLYDQILPGQELQGRARAHTHTHTHTKPTTMTYGRILYKNIPNVHPRNST